MSKVLVKEEGRGSNTNTKKRIGRDKVFECSERMMFFIHPSCFVPKVTINIENIDGVVVWGLCGQCFSFVQWSNLDTVVDNSCITSRIDKCCNSACVVCIRSPVLMTSPDGKGSRIGSQVSMSINMDYNNIGQMWFFLLIRQWSMTSPRQDIVMVIDNHKWPGKRIKKEMLVPANSMLGRDIITDDTGKRCRTKSSADSVVMYLFPSWVIEMMIGWDMYCNQPIKRTKKSSKICKFHTIGYN